MTSKNRVSSLEVLRFLGVALPLLFRFTLPTNSAAVAFRGPKDYPVGKAPISVIGSIAPAWGFAQATSSTGQPSQGTWDTMSDTWVATDGLGRTLPTHEEVGSPRKDRFVGIFYFLWLGAHGVDGPFNISEILARYPEAIHDKNHPAWGPMGSFHHWGESHFGYYLSDDAFVIRKHAHMLADAGVDVIIFDVTNQFTYREN